MNPMKLMKIKGAFEKFTANHPKFMPFIRAIGARGGEVGTLYEVTVTLNDGQTMQTNLKLTPDDLELFETLKELN